LTAISWAAVYYFSGGHLRARVRVGTAGMVWRGQIPEAALAELLAEERQRRSLQSEIPVKSGAASRGHEDSLRFTGELAPASLPHACITADAHVLSRLADIAY